MDHRVFGAIAVAVGVAAAIILPVVGLPLARPVGPSTTTTSSFSKGGKVLEHVVEHTTTTTYAINWLVCLPLAALMLLGVVLLLLPRHQAGTEPASERTGRE